MSGTGLPDWLVWVALILGTLAFWVVTFLAVRTLFVGEETHSPADTDDSKDADPPKDRLSRGEISIDEFVRLSVGSQAVTRRHPSSPFHH
ncbi:MAG: SHOCT domain-containing protein [Propionibacteriaceae bacterium]